MGQHHYGTEKVLLGSKNSQKLTKSAFTGITFFFFDSQNSLNQQLSSGAPGHQRGICYKCKFLGLSSDLLNQKLQGWGPAICVLICPPGESDAHWS